MTDPSGTNLNRTKLQRLLAAVGSAQVEGPTPSETEAAPYDWRDPHYFNQDQHNRLAAITSQVAAVLSERLAHFLNDEFNVVPTSITQHFANDLGRLIDEELGFSLSFGLDSRPPCGSLVISADVAMDWVNRLLGDSEANQTTDRILSALEQSLLSHLVNAMAEAFLSSLEPHQNLKPADEVVRGPIAAAFEPTDPICRIAFQVRKAEAESVREVAFIMSGRALAPVVGKAIQSETTIPQDQLARLLMEHVQQMPVPISARLGATRLSFEEAADLAPGDVLLLDKPLNEPVDLIVHNQIVCRGRPAQSAGQYAVFVTECTTGCASDVHSSQNAN